MTSTVGDIGTILEVVVYEDGVILDASTATGMTILVTRPDGTVQILPGAFSTDGTDGKIYGVADAATFSIKGRYCYEARFSLGAWIGSTTGVHLKVRLPGVC